MGNSMRTYMPNCACLEWFWRLPQVNMPHLLKIPKGLSIVKAGFLRKFKKGFLCKGFKVVYAEVSRDGFLLWYRDQFSHKRDGVVDLKEVCHFLAVGPYTRSIPSRVILPKCVPERNLMAVPSSPSRHAVVNWFLCANDLDLNEWMMTINCVLLPPKDHPLPILAAKSSGQLEKAASSAKDLPSTESNASLDFKSHEDAVNGSSPYESILSASIYASIATLPTPSTSSTNATDESFKLAEKMEGLKVKPPLTTTHNGSRLPIPPPPSMPAKGAYLSDWGWFWGCGMGWGIEGWSAYEFVPSMGSEVNMEALRQALQVHNNLEHQHYDQNHECHMQEQGYNEYDCTEYEAGIGDVGFDSSIDIGGIFDAGFSFGF